MKKEYIYIVIAIVLGYYFWNKNKKKKEIISFDEGVKSDDDNDDDEVNEQLQNQQYEMEDFEGEIIEQQFPKDFTNANNELHPIQDLSTDIGVMPDEEIEPVQSSETGMKPITEMETVKTLKADDLKPQLNDETEGADSFSWRKARRRFKKRRAKRRARRKKLFNRMRPKNMIKRRKKFIRKLRRR